MPCALNLFPDTVLHTDTASCQNITALRSPSLHIEPDLQRVNRLRKSCIVPDTTLPVLAYPLLIKLLMSHDSNKGGGVLPRIDHAAKPRTRGCSDTAH